MEGDIQERREALLYVLTQRPFEVRIHTLVVSGDSASFIVEGNMRYGEKATGAVVMILEKGNWKVLEDKWKITGK